MKKYLVQPLDLPKSSYFNPLPLLNVSSKTISKHTKAILSQCAPLSDDLRIKQFTSEKFWKKLLKDSSNQPEIQKIFTLWKKIEPLAHLDTAQIIRLLEEHILPLERRYEYLLFHFPQKNIISQINKNMESLQALKKIIYCNLYLRATTHTLLNTSRNVDDILAAICHQINQLAILDKPILSPKPLSATCHDDNRILIYDWLQMTGYPKAQLDNIIAPISRHSRVQRKTGVSHKMALLSLNRFRNKMLKTLLLQGFSRKYFLRTQPLQSKQTLLSWIANKTTKPIISWFDQLGLMAWSQKLYPFRYIFYFVLSMLSYFFLMLVMPPLLVPFGAWISIKAISSILFYGVGLFPLWMVGAKVGMHGYFWFRGYCNARKTQQILNSLILIEELQHFMADKLSHLVIDLAHVDIGELSMRAKQFSHQLAKSKTKLAYFTMTEKWLLPSKMMNAAGQVNKKIELLENSLSQSLKKLASHLTKRLGEDITLLDVSIEEQKLLPIISVQQVAKLRKFVIQFGDKKTITLFNQNTQLEYQWLNKIKQDEFLTLVGSTRELSTPWGSYQLRNNALAGWQTLLAVFTQDKQKRQILLTLHQLLKSKKSVSLTIFNQLLKKLKQKDLKKAIQSLLFKTLSARHPSCAQLLSKRHQQQIIDYYLKYHAQIKRANKWTDQLFSHHKNQANRLQAQIGLVSTKKIRRYVALLDVQALYYHATGETSLITQRHNTFRTYFKNYQGQDDFAYPLITFLPRHEQSTLIVAVAQKRLTWILQQVKSHKANNWKFTAIDKALFNDYLLHENQRFNFTRCIENSTIFQAPWTRCVADFLKSCQQAGLDSGHLLTHYQARNQRKNSAALLNAYEHQKYVHMDKLELKNLAPNKKNKNKKLYHA